MGSRTAFVSMTARSSPFSYTDSGPGKPALKDGQHENTGEHQLKQLPQENTKGSKKTGIRSIFRGKKDKHKSTPPASPRNSNDYTPYESTVLNKVISPAVKAPSDRGRKTKANVKKKIDSGSTLRFAGEEGLPSSKEHIYESPADAQESSDNVYQCNKLSYEETQWRGSSHHTPAGTRGRRTYAAIPLPTKSALRTTASLPNCYSPRFTKKLPARQASFGHKIHSRLESPQGDEMGGTVYCDDDDYDVGGMYSQIAENIEHYDDVVISNDMYEEVVIAANTKIPSADPSDDDDDDLCTDSCDVGKLSLQSSYDDERVNCLNALPVKPRPKIENKNSSRVNAIQQDCKSDDQDARYVPTGTISTPQPGPNNPKPKPKPKPPKPTPRARSSLMSQGPKQPSKDIIKIPPQPAKKPNELPEIQLLVDEAWKLINNSEKNNSTKLIVTSVDFTAGFLDKKGGRLQLRYHGVTLDVPPGALEDVEMVYIYVQRSLEFSPIGEEGFASPLVHCGLSGLKFKTPVVLTFPVHLEDPSAWELKGIQQDSSGTPWKEISSESCPDSLVVFKDRLCTMVVDHFTLFGVSARPKELRGASGGSDESHGVLPLRVGVFLPSDKTTMSGRLQLRVRIWDESQDTLQRVKDDERHSKVVDTTCRLHLRTTEGSGSQQPDLDVSVGIRELNDSWTSNPKEKIIPYENFHLDPRVDESVTFNLRLHSRDSEGGLHPLLCDFVIGQRAHPNQAKIVRAVVDIHDGGLRIETAHESPNPMSTSGFRRLRDYLERERRWKLLADSSFGKTQGCTFDRWQCPSTAVLNAIFSRSVAQNPEAKLQELYFKFCECSLSGAADIVCREMNEWQLGVTGSETSQATGSQSRKSPEPKFPVQCSGEDSSLPRPICNAQQESLYEVLMPKEERERIAQARPTTTWNRASRREPEENDEEESRIHTLQSINPPAQAQPERICQARPSSTGNRASSRAPEENDEEESRIHTLRSTNPPARAQPERIDQARPSPTVNRASPREPEENEEEESRIHTLQSINPPAQAPPSFIPRTPRKPLATQQDRLLRLVPTHVDLKSNGAYEETTAFGGNVRHELSSSNHQPTTKNSPVPQSHQPPDFMINPIAEEDALPYAECLVTDQSGHLENNNSSIYQNAQVIPPSSSSSQLTKGYVQIKK